MNDFKSISKLNFCLTSDKEQIFTLNFKDGLNVIIGPKGGGKSILLKMLHSFHNMMKEKDCNSAYKDFGFECLSIEYDNGSFIKTASLGDLDKNKYDDFIKQEDDVKTSLNKNKDVKNEKSIFLQSVINPIESNIVNLIKEYINSIDDIWNLKNRHENWEEVLNYLDTKSDKIVNIINDLENKKFDSKLEINLKSIKSLIVYNELYHEALLKYVDINQKNDFVLSNGFNLIDLIVEMKKLHENQLEPIFLNKSMHETISSFINKKKKELQESKNREKSINTAKNSIKSFFKDAATYISKFQAYYDCFSNDEYSINIHRKENIKRFFGLEFSINSKIDFTPFGENNSIFNFFDDLIYKPKKSQNWMDIIENALTKDSSLKINYNNEQEISKKFGKWVDKVFIDEIRLFADGKDYQHLSLGTRTSFGLKTKIKSFDSSIIFIDQPEDNLDNHTIYKEILALLKKGANSRIKQIFLVTHNSNLGTLSNPSTITTCNLEKDNFYQSYNQQTDIKTQIKIDNNTIDSPALHYLEGGQSSLEERKEMLIGRDGNK